MITTPAEELLATTLSEFPAAASGDTLGAREKLALVVRVGSAVTWILPSDTSVLKEWMGDGAGASSMSPVHTLKQARKIG